MSPTRGALGLTALLFVAAGGGWLYWFVTRHGFSAREKPTRVEAFLARRARDLATPAGAKRLSNPLPSSPLNVAEGRDHFADHCALCHANDGSGKTMINEGLCPPAPDLRENTTQHLSDGELLYIIKNGIRFTGMPGWAGDDEDNWKLVLFIRHLRDLSDKELELMKEINGLDTHVAQGEETHDER